ncbi:hypothetical protein QVD99_007584 [Batrachochytrium dendrobatidis]|nr:hypothetical protein QVD99_007584 [Batrachochytrium dendrobatidis]
MMHAQSVVMPNRPHDYLYDTNYTVAGKSDHLKAMAKAQAQQVVINPHFENMFSSLRHYPTTEYSLKPQRLLPGIGQDRRVDASQAYVVGSDRFKYFKRPIMPYMPGMASQIVYAKKQHATAQDTMQRPASPYAKTVGTQTLYRESEAQTDPYSPEYLLRPNLPPPELLALATLTYGAGLPAGVAELEMIERARVKRAWESTLPLVVDQETFERRLKMMEEMELKEWQERELEIKRLQEARLKILTTVIQKREQENETVNNSRIDRIWQRKLQERDAAFEKINQKRIKAIRKLTEKRAKVENKIEKRDIITDYADHGSRVYAPKAREGTFADKASSTLQIKIEELESYSALVELEKSFSPFVLTAKTQLPKWKSSAKSCASRKELHIQTQLENMALKLQERNIKNKIQETPIKYAIKIEKPPRRPPTPSIHIPSEEDEEMEVASIFLQKLIKGRISQNLMYQGKERRLALINELRICHIIKKEQANGENISVPTAALEDFLERSNNTLSRETYIRNQGGELLLDLDDQSYKTLHKKQLTESTILPSISSDKEKLETMFESTIQGEYIGKTLDFLTKELVRLREERRIDAMVMLAERTRKIREAEESGKRQSEMQQREQEDEIFKQVMQVHQETVDTYLQDIVSENIGSTADQQARIQAQEYATKIDHISQLLVTRDAESGTCNMIEDLVSSFLFPHVERQMLKSKVQQDQEKYLLAAHDAVFIALVEKEKLLQDSISNESQQPVQSEPSLQDMNDKNKTAPQTPKEIDNDSQNTHE